MSYLRSIGFIADLLQNFCLPVFYPEQKIDALRVHQWEELIMMQNEQNRLMSL
jgi:hypothetical protein